MSKARRFLTLYRLSIATLLSLGGIVFYSASEAAEVSKFCQTYNPKGEIFDGKMYCDALAFQKISSKQERACDQAVSNEITHNENPKASNCNYCRMFRNCMKGKSLLHGSARWK